MKATKMTALRTFLGQFPPDIYEVVYDFDGLRVRIDPETDGRVVIFSDFIGFRLLDEGDLLEFWSDNDNPLIGWIYEVQSGGWLELESKRDGFLSSDRKGLKEYLVATTNGCLSVLAFGEPKMVT